MTIITRSIRVPTPAERLAEFRRLWALLHGPQFTDYFYRTSSKDQA